MTPAVLVDKAGVVLLWSLPEVLSSHFQDLMWEALNPINAMLACSIAEPKANSTWCMVHSNFEGVDIQGYLNFSPAWFQQGRNASTSCPEVSATLKARNPDQGGRSWLEWMMLPAAVLSVVMAIMHPDLYATGHEAVVHLYQDLAIPHPDEPALVEMAEMLRLWLSVFTAASVMVNRSTPFHRNSHHGQQWPSLEMAISSGGNQW
ncbi:hypothetical protein PAXRUDRAFT_179217 [Paxillus rubicundulus Ve08.2h10]|uniref:Uncharacterized protein n=1 Tax=Paxillus rubicundulus Ve08.2h10 TaxID=930991 RepID=A0A0D0BNF4_9AGAM|nr:hypothetical protein PAXRUDRAFT_179217 [Paxillus rubicundulus Ve08.2h10]